MASALGIYFGPKIITLVESKGRKVSNYVKIPRSTLVDAELEEKVPEDVKMVAVFNDELRRNRIEAKEASICLSGRDLIVRSFELPMLPSAELAAAVNFEAKKYIPFKVEDLVSDFQVELDKVSRKNLILYLGIKKDALERYLSILRQLNIKVDFLDYSAFSVLRFLKLTGLGKKGIVGIISMDSREEDEANFTVLENGFPVFSRDLTLTSGPEELTKPEETASAAMMLEKIKTEIRISLDYYHRKFPVKTIGNLFFITDETYIADLEFFMKDLDLPFKFVDANKYIGKNQAFSLSFIKGYGCSLSKSVKTDLKLNLLAPKAKGKVKVVIPKKTAAQTEELSLLSFLRVDPKFLTLGVMICAAAFGYGYYKTLPVRSDIKNIVAVRPQVEGVAAEASLEELQNIDADYKNRLTTIDNLISKQLYFTEAMEAISRSIPDDLWLSDINIKDQGNRKVDMTLRGQAYLGDSEKELNLINTFVSSLKENSLFNKYFKEVSIVSIEQKPTGKIKVSNFMIVCKTGGKT